MKNFFYQQAIRNYSSIMIDLFDNMVVRDSRGDTTFEKKIPIEYVPKEKLFYFLQEQQNETQLDTSLPRMSVHINTIDIAMDRALNTYAQRRFILPSNTHRDRHPVPYNFDFGLSFFVKYTDHMAQILENILPFFNPSLIVKVKEQGIDDISREIKVTLQSVTPNIQTEYSDSERRFIHGDLTFLLEGWIYKPLTSGTGLIHNVCNNFFDTSFVPQISGGFPTESVCVSGTGTRENPSYVVTYTTVGPTSTPPTSTPPTSTPPGEPVPAGFLGTGDLSVIPSIGGFMGAGESTLQPPTCGFVGSGENTLQSVTSGFLGAGDD